MLERIFRMTGAYDLRRPNPHRNYGIHGMDMYFAVKGPAGAVNATIQTKWYLPHSAPDSYKMYTGGYPFNGPEELCMPNFIDIGQHHKVPQYEEQSCMSECCLTDGPCYYDGTSLWGNEAWREGFLHGGTDWLWLRLEEYYRHVFESGPEPDLTPVPRKHPDDL